jgi:mannosyltransferase OCH1-like enzyme
MKPAISTIIQYWAQEEQPAMLREMTLTWQRLNPGWSYRCFNRATASLFFKDVFGVSVQEDFLSIRLPAMQADVFRVAYILTYGGLWADAATTCLSPLEHWLDPQSPLVLLRRPHMHSAQVANGFIYAHQPQHPFLEAVWSSIASALARRAGTGVWTMFGAGIFGKTLMDVNLARQVRVVEVRDITQHLSFGSSSMFMPAKQHWSTREKHEPLYL